MKVPFQHEEYQCTMMEYSTYVARSMDFVIPIGPNLSPHCNPLEKNMCYVPTYTKNPSSFSSCAEALFSAKEELIEKVFSFFKNKQYKNYNVNGTCITPFLGMRFSVFQI